MQNKITAILGRKFSGKSHKLHELLRDEPRIVIWDVLGEHAWCPNRITDLMRLDSFLRWSRKRERFAAHFVPLRMQNLESFDVLCDAVYRRGHLTFGVEEVALVSEPNWLPDGFDTLVRLGRHHGINIVWTSQRAGEVARRLTSATDIFIIFRHTEPRDLDAIEERCGVEVRDRVSRLGLHEHLTWNVETGEIESADRMEVRAKTEPSPAETGEVRE